MIIRGMKKSTSLEFIPLPIIPLTFLRFRLRRPGVGQTGEFRLGGGVSHRNSGTAECIGFEITTFDTAKRSNRAPFFGFCFDITEETPLWLARHPKWNAQSAIRGIGNKSILHIRTTLTTLRAGHCNRGCSFFAKNHNVEIPCIAFFKSDLRLQKLIQG
jgi:hypothetical protein